MKNAEAIRGGGAMRRGELRPTRLYHVDHNSQGYLYLCGCAKGIMVLESTSRLGRGRRSHDRFAAAFRYK